MDLTAPCLPGILLSALGAALFAGTIASVVTRWWFEDRIAEQNAAIDFALTLGYSTDRREFLRAWRAGADGALQRFEDWPAFRAKALSGGPDDRKRTR